MVWRMRDGRGRGTCEMNREGTTTRGFGVETKKKMHVAVSEKTKKMIMMKTDNKRSRRTLHLHCFENLALLRSEGAVLDSARNRTARSRT